MDLYEESMFIVCHNDEFAPANVRGRIVGAVSYLQTPSFKVEFPGEEGQEASVCYVPIAESESYALFDMFNIRLHIA